MDDFSNGVLCALIKIYHGSVLSKGGSAKKLKIKIDTNSKALSTYRGRDAFKYTGDNDAKLLVLQNKGYIFVNRDRDGLLESVELNLSKVDEIISACGLSNRNEQLSKINSVFYESEHLGFVCDFVQSEREYIATKYEWHKSYYCDEKELGSILKVLNAMVCQTEEIMERDFSVKVLGDSKAFSSIRKKIVSIVKKFDSELVFDDKDSDEKILSNYNIVKNSTYALIKGNLNFKLNEQIINLDRLGFEYSLSDAMIKNLEFLPSEFKRLITVENLTSFYKINEKDSVVIYLAGFHNHTKQLLIKKLYSAFEIEECYHFGDIDAGGFSIFNNLVQATDIRFIPYKMGIAELESCKQSVKPLTANDRTRLERMRSDADFSVFAEVIDYMLLNDVKLEQEALD